LNGPFNRCWIGPLKPSHVCDVHCSASLDCHSLCVQHKVFSQHIFILIPSLAYCKLQGDVKRLRSSKNSSENVPYVCLTLYNFYLLVLIFVAAFVMYVLAFSSHSTVNGPQKG
jgi:hypothetical protein